MSKQTTLAAADQTAPAEEPLRLLVFDEDDLAVVSTHLQEAEVRLGDMAYLPKTKRFALAASRFDWTRAASGVFERCFAGLHFERVLKVAQSGLDIRATDRAEVLLALAFIPDDPPAGSVILTFANGGQVKLMVECLEAAFRDMGPRWTVADRPGHLLDAAGTKD